MKRRDYPILFLMTGVCVVLCTTACLTASLDTAGDAEQTFGPVRNNFPIILVHGVMGWGRDQFSGFYYWGGTFDLETELREMGYDVHTAVVGPVSSNWDRACELYACIKGGRVDYGKSHSAEYGHARFGCQYPGLIDDWGEVDPDTGQVRKVHIIGHSMGGQTARLLAHLLVNGAQAEKGIGECHELFRGDKNWIASITTLSAPHDGSTLTDAFDVDHPFVMYITGWWGVLTESYEFPRYDLRLDHWGLQKRDAESWGSYRNRIMNNPIWLETEDTALYDTSIPGAGELNATVASDPKIYYFSWATQCSKPNIDGRYHVPDTGMLPFLRYSSRLIGKHVSKRIDELWIDRSWLPNDGVVNTISMDGPAYRSSDTIVAWNGTPTPGVWNYMGELDSCDHLDIIGVMRAEQNLFRTIPNLTKWYAQHLDLLRSLPPDI